jgi:exopolysaccharide biosynthesis polyprenyl glycosylphosphotransferase
LFGRHKKKRVILFALADVILTIFTFELAYRIRVALPLEHLFYMLPPTKALLIGTAIITWAGLGFLLRVYDRLESGEPSAILRDSIQQVAAGTLLIVSLLFLLKLDVSRSFIGLFAFSNVIALIVARARAGDLRRGFGATSFFLIVGTGETGRQVAKAFEQAEPYGIKLRAFVDVAEPSPQAEIALGHVYPVHAVAELPALLRNQVIDEIIFAVDREKLSELEDIFLLCDEEGVRTRVVVNFFPHVNSEVFLDQFGSFSLLTFAATPHDEIRLFLKRALDFSLALATLIVLALPLGLIALLVRITSRGPAIFRQVRCGLNGRRFTFYKLRSMCQDAEIKKPELARLNERDGPVFKMSKDPRLTPLGRYLRRFSIDEWPQLWNVLRGDMSFVGPRPALPSEVEHYKPWQRRRLRMKPGLTCLWVLQGRDHLDFETWMRLDMEYIDNWSLLLDLKILLRSFPRVLLGRGAS